MPRVYAVETADEQTLVMAETQAQALNHVIKSTYSVRVASSVDVVEYMNAGGKVEDALKAPEAAAEEAGAVTAPEEE